MSKIAFIGAGNMAASIIGGLTKQRFSAADIVASDPSTAALTQLQTRFGVRVTASNIEATSGADIIVLAVKPQMMAAVCRDLAHVLAPSALVISIAAGITCASLQHWLGDNLALVRAMPNTPALIQMGATGLYATAKVTEPQQALAEAVLGAVGLVHWVAAEPLLDAVTAVSGSGPAYFFLLLEAMIATAESQGLDTATARALALQTARGAAELALHSDVDVAELRRRVTSPGGTTEQAIRTFEARDFRATVAEAMQACKRRAEQLALELGDTP